MNKSTTALRPRSNARRVESKPNLTATSPCPECGHKGPHGDNGCEGAFQTFCCDECGSQFDAVQPID